jgi:hypothetical protein
MSELPAWSLPAGAAKDIALGADWPAELTHEWAYGGAAGKGVRDCILDSGVDASHPSVGHVEGVASAPSTSRQPLRKPPYRRSLFDSMSNHIANSVNCEPKIRSSATSTPVAAVMSWPRMRSTISAIPSPRPASPITRPKK